MKNLWRALGLVVMTLALLATPVWAQESSSVKGGLSGTITDPSGAVVPGATITLSGPQGTKTATTDSLGRFVLTGLTPGFYDVTVEKSGFKKAVSKHNNIVVDKTSTLNLPLTVGAAGEEVTVDATAVNIDTTSTAVTSNLTDQFYDSVPMQRNVANIFYTAPGVVAGGTSKGTGISNPSIGGASGLENLYVADGVSVTDQAFGGLGTYNRYYGSVGTGINLSFIKEVDVKTAGFEPQYGKATGGIVQIVTKSGGEQYHGAVAAFLGPGSWYATRYQPNQFGYVNATPASILSTPQYDASFEFGGPVPLAQKKVFFFLSVDPTLNQVIEHGDPYAPTTTLWSHGPYAFSTTTFSWSTKLSVDLTKMITLEASTYADPSHHNSAPNTGWETDANLSTTNAGGATSRYNYGSRNSVVRLNAALSPTWAANASYSYNYNKFSETPLQNNYYSVSDRTNPTYVAYGFGAYEPTKNNTYSLSFDTTKTVKVAATPEWPLLGLIAGTHTLTMGYSYDHTNFIDQPSRSGPLFAIPTTEVNGTSLLTDFSTVNGLAAALGQMTNATFRVYLANPYDPTDQTCTYCAKIPGTNERIYMQQIRGSWKGMYVNATGRYHVAYGNDSYQMNRWVNIDGGVRWEEQRIGGSVLNYAFTDSWSPRIGINIDPIGDHKNKIFFNYARYFYALPLDAAIRQLGNEQDDSFYFNPQTDGTGHATIAGDGTYAPNVSSVLNGKAVNEWTCTAATIAAMLAANPTGTPCTLGAVTQFSAPTFSSSTGEGILKATKAEYENEFVLGFERQLSRNWTAQTRYTNRRFGRIIEDVGTQSPEGSVVDQGYNGGITNPSPSLDIGINEQEVTYTTATTSTQKTALGCTTANDTGYFYGYKVVNGVPTVVNKGGACILNYLTAGGAGTGYNGGDGQPDGFVRPTRSYQAVEVQLTRKFANNWFAQFNYRWAKLYGNYEGSFRNDNGQSDPGISSLFDFTTGELGLLGDQFKNGYINTDRRNVGNAFVSYTIAGDTPYVHMLKGLTVGSGLRGQSGIPINALGGHPAPSYADAGEVPVGGRGTWGRMPSTLQWDLHGSYPVNFGEKYKLKLALDAFNVTNSQLQTDKNEDLDNGYSSNQPVVNADYKRPLHFNGPFFARASIRFEF